MKIIFALCIQILLLSVLCDAQDDHDFHSEELLHSDELDHEFNSEEEVCEPGCTVHSEECDDVRNCPQSCHCPLKDNTGAPECGGREGCEFKPPCAGCEPNCVCGPVSKCEAGCELDEECLGCKAICKCPIIDNHSQLDNTGNSGYPLHGLN